MMAEPWIWLNPGEPTGKADCGCELNREHETSDDPAVILCPLHSSAEELLTMLDEVTRSATLTGGQLARLTSLLTKAKSGVEVDFDPLLGQFTDDPENAPYIDRRTGEFIGLDHGDDTILARFPGRDIPKDDWNIFIPIDEDGDVEKAKRQWDEMERKHRKENHERKVP